MSGPFASLLAVPGIPAFAVLVLKATILVGVGALISELLRGASAAVRHFVWVLTLGGAVVLAIASPIAPPLKLRVGTLPMAQPAPAPTSADSPTPSIGSLREITRDLSTQAPGVPGQQPTRAPSIGELLAAVWLVGALAVAGWCALGHSGLSRLLRESTPLASHEWQSLLGSVAARSGVTARVRLARAPAVHAPVTWGARRPVVLLPDDAESWSFERRRVVLAHELAHAARGDYLVQLLACVACAIYWFHPLVWIAARRLRIESERASDDHVLLRGTPGTEYAAHLLAVARRARASGAEGMLAIGMAQKSQLEGRLLAVLDENRPRHAPRRRLAASFVVAALTLPLAALRIVPGAAHATPRPEARAARAESGTGSFERELNAANGEQLLLDLESGGQVSLEGWDRPTVRVRARLAGRDWRETRVTLEREGGGMRLHAWQAGDQHSSSTSHEFEISVPRHFNLRIHSAGGGLMLTDLQGEFSGSTGGGEFVIERVKGTVALETGGGDIQITDVDLIGHVNTGGGKVSLSGVRGPLSAWSGSGPAVREEGGGSADALEHVADREVTTIAGEADAWKESGERKSAGRVRINKAGGDVDLESAPEGAEIHTGGGEVTVGPSAGFVEARTGGGDIEIGPVDGSVRASTGSGDVRVTITGKNGVERSVDIWTGTGSAVLELPPGLSARFELETAYTNNFGRRTRIDSDWKLEREETTQWDSHQGTPRKYVRAKGQVGEGGGLIHVKIVNGDITVRRGTGSAPARR